MRVKFRLPANGFNLSTREKSNSEDTVKNSEGSPQSRKPRRQVRKKKKNPKSRKGQKGSPGSKGFRRKASALKGRVHSPGKKGGKGNFISRHVLKKPFKKKPKKVARRRTVEVIDLSNSDAFGPFNDIVELDSSSLDIIDIDQAKRSMKSINEIPVTLRFFVDASKLRQMRITSATITLERGIQKPRVSNDTGNFLSPSLVRRLYQKAEQASRDSVISTRYINFENVYDLKEEIKYKVTTSRAQIKRILGFPEADMGGVVRKAAFEPNVIKASQSTVVKSYSRQITDWRQGKGKDPGHFLNMLPSVGMGDDKFAGSTSVIEKLGTNFGLKTGNYGSSTSRPTSDFVFSNKISDAAQSLTRITQSEVVKDFFELKSKMIPVVVNFYIDNPKYLDGIKARIQLNTNNSFGEQIAAIGAKNFEISRKIKMCLLPLNPPSITAKPVGSGFVRVELVQNDYAASHVTVFIKSLDSLGGTVVGWRRYATVKCTSTAGMVIDASRTKHHLLCIRAVASNTVGHSSKYSAAQVRNFRPTIASKDDTEVTPFGRAPIIIAIRGKDGAKLFLENCQFAKNIKVFREDMSTGAIHQAYAAGVSQSETFRFSDNSVKVGKIYRYFVSYSLGTTLAGYKISDKDAIYKHCAVDPVSAGINLTGRGVQTSTGGKTSIGDDSVSISLGVKPTQKGFDAVIDLLKSLGVEGLVEGEAKKSLRKLENIYALRTTRINLVTGERNMFQFQPFSLKENRILVSDSYEPRRKSDDSAMLPPIPGFKYAYVTRLYFANIEDLLGGENASEQQIARPSGSRTTLKGVSRRFISSTSSRRGIMPSEDFVQNDLNYGNTNASYIRNYTGVEIINFASIPKSHNFVRNVTIEKVSSEFSILSWEFGGDTRELDHFVIEEVAPGRKSPIGAKHPHNENDIFNFVIINSDLTYDRSYTINAYDDDGNVIASGNSYNYIPNARIPDAVLKKMLATQARNLKGSAK